MGQEIIRVIEQISKEKGIDKQIFIEAVEAAIVSAAKKSYKLEENVSAHLNEETGEIELYQIYDVVSEVEDDAKEISLAKAKEIDPELKEGDEAKIKLESHDLGRIAAPPAKQVIVQRLR